MPPLQNSNQDKNLIITRLFYLLPAAPLGLLTGLACCSAGVRFMMVLLYCYSTREYQVLDYHLIWPLHNIITQFWSIGIGSPYKSEAWSRHLNQQPAINPSKTVQAEGRLHTVTPGYNINIQVKINWLLVIHVILILSKTIKVLK